MSTTTAQDVITAAMSVARDAAEGRLDPAELERQAVAELQELMAVDPEPGSPLAELQLDVARRVLARGDLGADEVAEWAAVARSRSTAPEPDIAPPTPLSTAHGDTSQSDDGTGDD